MADFCVNVKGTQTMKLELHSVTEVLPGLGTLNTISKTNVRDKYVTQIRM